MSIFNFIKEQLKLLPAQPGVYLMYDAQERIIYVGKALSLRNRVRSYFHDSSDHAPKIAQMVEQVVSFDTIITDTEVEALVLEADLIRKYQPRYNTLLKNHQGFPYIRITWQETYPRIQLARQRKQNDRAVYYGPYPSRSAVYHLLEAIRNIFPVEKCKDPRKEKRTCLYYNMKRCMGHCQGKITPEDYRDMLQGIRLFLEGKSDTLREKMEQQMLRQAQRLQFEEAAQTRDILQAMNRVMKPARTQKIVNNPRQELDIFYVLRQGNLCHLQLFQIRQGIMQPPLPNTFNVQGDDEDSEILQQFLYDYYANIESGQIPPEILLPFELPDQALITKWLETRKKRRMQIKIPQRGKKKDLLAMVEKNVRVGLQKAEMESRWKIAEDGLAELQFLLNLPQAPYRIEAFDISHFQGQDTVASMVVFVNGQPARQEYRRFRIQGSEGLPNDFLSMQEVVSRRYRRSKRQENPEPDLILIDGGKGQVSAALKACAYVGYVPSALIGLAKKDERIILPDRRDALHLPRQSSALRLLQQIRDESHRFAITYHRTLRKKRTLGSELESIPGIGAQRSRKMLRAFGSVAKIKAATVEALVAVGRIPEPIAQQVKEYFERPDEHNAAFFT